MENQDDIWKKMTTPIEVDTSGNCTFLWVKDTFDFYRNNGHCVRCPISNTIHNMPYRRSLSKTMAKALREFYKKTKNFSNAEISATQIGDFPKLKHWDLIRKHENGYWYVTQLGIDFLNGNARVPKYVILVNNIKKQYFGDHVSIYEILGS